MPADQPKPRPGRPRRWSSEAERKRAYRQRKAKELSEPLHLREAAKAAQAASAEAVARADAATRDAERWRRRAQTAQKEAERAREVARRARERAERSTAERDEARRLLRRKLQHARHAAAIPGVRDDPQVLLAIIAELYPELERLRAENTRYRSVPRWTGLT